MKLRRAVSKISVSLFAFMFLLIAGELSSFGQATGSIVGSVTDPSAARMPGVTVTITNPAIGIRRSAVTNEIGYGFSSLQPGDYEITAEMAGFKRTVKHATVNVGREVTVDFTLEVGEVAQTLDVTAEASAINLVSTKVDQIVEQSQISDLPLNGRAAFEMAKLVPGVVVNYITGRNNEAQVSIVGKASGNATGTRYMVDGLSITDVFGGGTSLNVSQEVVQEFQVSINNNDPSIGISSSGAVNLVTRSGSNAFHGSFFGFFRDSQYAAFPGLSHPAPLPNPNNDPSIAAFNETQTSPGFYRRQFGGILSGPILKNHLFYLASVEDYQLVSAVTFNTGSSDLAPFNSIVDYPRRRLLQDYRLDWRATDKHSFFVSYMRDKFYAITPGLTTLASSFPSWNLDYINRAEVVMAAWTAVWSPSLVSDTRVGVTRLQFLNVGLSGPTQEAQLYAPQLPYMGDVTISGTNMEFGNNNGLLNNYLAEQPQVVSNFTYIHGKSTWKFGMDYTPVRFWDDWTFDSPFVATVFNPTQARQAGISVPSTFTTIGDLLQLPLSSLRFPVGNNPTYPFQLTGPGHDHLWASQVYAYLGDSYKATPRLTLNLSLGYTYDPTTSPDRYLPRPASMAPFLNGGNLNPPQAKKDEFSPVVGFAWDPRGGGKTVIRGGFGVYYPTGSAGSGREDSQLLPVGDGYLSVPGTYVTNPKTGTGTLSFGSAGANAAAGIFRLSDLVKYISGIQAGLNQTLFTGNNQNFSVTNFDYFKGATTAIRDFQQQPYSLQSMVGVQRQVGQDWLLDATTVYNVTNHTPFTQDANRLFTPGSGPVVPGFGQVLITKNAGKANYRGLLLSARKRLAHRYQVSASYTLSSYKETEATLINYTNFKGNYGYDPVNPKQALNTSFTMDLPWGLQVALLFGVQSKPPFNPVLSGVDLNSNGTSSNILPGLSPDCVNMSCSADDLRKGVAQFNQTYAGTRDVLGTLIQPINLPAHFSTGDDLITQDMRLTKKIKFGERVQLNLMGEVFNLLNIANLTFAAASANLYSSGFGLPTSRQGYVLGDGGPRSFQFAARVSF